MGCWEETCGLTNAPIYAGEACVLVALDRQRLLNLFAHESPIGMCGGLDQWLVVTSIHHGTYNDYGWIEEFDAPEDFHRETIFFHKAAWDLALKIVNEPEIFGDPDFAGWSTKRMGLNITQELIEFAQVCTFAYEMRRDIFSGLKFRGHQESSLDSARTAFLALQQTLFESQKARFQE